MRDAVIVAFCFGVIALFCVIGTEDVSAQVINYTFPDVNEHLIISYEPPDMCYMDQGFRLLNDSGEPWIGFRLEIVTWYDPFTTDGCEYVADYNGPGNAYYRDLDLCPGMDETMVAWFLFSEIFDGNYLIFDVDICRVESITHMEIYGDPIVLRLALLPIGSVHVPHHLISYGIDAMFVPGQPFALINETEETWTQYRAWLVGKDEDGSHFPVRFEDVDGDQVVYEGPGTPHFWNIDGETGPDMLAISDISIAPMDTLFFYTDIKGYPPEGIVSVDVEGAAFYTGTTDAEMNDTFASCHLYQNHPNPFNPSTNISFYIPERSGVLLEIFDVKGSLVRSLVNRIYDKGFYSETWDGTDNHGNNVASGIYFSKLTVGNEILNKKMVLLR